ncbi:hypothetical protein NMG46_07015 [Mesorhizobium sp. LMG 17147]|uniref:hypothetical protein n=1 Tax=Mesorhizobium sp. LMG 17147 TaxID=2963091 RepID=UPI0020C95C77|nr:hypothetical protein [Mesorhizobium sp. LMG 17147]MCP9229995.1 hypothetical protein [Mesorhizobium sp. LMG 17147]
MKPIGTSVIPPSYAFSGIVTAIRGAPAERHVVTTIAILPQTTFSENELVLQGSPYPVPVGSSAYTYAQPCTVLGNCFLPDTYQLQADLVLPSGVGITHPAVPAHHVYLWNTKRKR